MFVLKVLLLLIMQFLTLTEFLRKEQNNLIFNAMLAELLQLTPFGSQDKTVAGFTPINTFYMKRVCSICLPVRDLP